jgi:hypothetical protein
VIATIFADGSVRFILDSTPTEQGKEKYDKRYSAQDAANRMKSAPPSQQTTRFF